MNGTSTLPRAVALAAADVAGGAALYRVAPGLGLLLAAAGVLVLGTTLHGLVADGSVAPRVPRRS